MTLIDFDFLLNLLHKIRSLLLEDFLLLPTNPLQLRPVHTAVEPLHLTVLVDDQHRRWVSVQEEHSLDRYRELPVHD